MKVSKYISTGFLLCFLLVVGTVGAANYQAVPISKAKVPASLILHSGDQNALFLTGTADPVKETWTKYGFVVGDMYQWINHEGSSFYYGIVADVRPKPGVGIFPLKTAVPASNQEQLLTVPSMDPTASDDTELASIAAAINQNGALAIHPYRVVIPMTEQKNHSYIGILRTSVMVNGVSRQEDIHVLLYENIYLGPTARIVVLNQADEEAVWSDLAPLFKMSK